MKSITSNFILQLKHYIDTLFKSYESQCCCMFSDSLINRYGKVMNVKTQCYIPRRISKPVSIRYLVIIIKELSQGGLRHLLRSKIKIETLDIQFEICRMVSPALNSYVLARYFVYMASNHHFRRIIYKMEQTMIYRFFRNATINYKKSDPIHSKDKILGLELKLHGRIPREPVRARKTVQTRTIGRRSVRIINQHPALIHRAEGIHPELGTFSIWIRLII